MKKLLFIMLLSVPLFGQTRDTVTANDTPNQGRTKWNSWLNDVTDSIGTHRTAINTKLTATDTASLSNRIDDAVDTAATHRTNITTILSAQNLVADTTALKALTSTAPGEYRYLKEIASGVDTGAGWFVVIDSAFVEDGYNAFGSATAGKQWIREAVYTTRYPYRQLRSRRFYDDFQRANGVLGNPVLGPPWNPVGGGDKVIILNNLAQADSTQGGGWYGYYDMGSAELKYRGGYFSFVGDSASNTVVLSISPISSVFDSMIHIRITRTSLDVFITGTDSTAFELGEGPWYYTFIGATPTFDDTLVSDGTQYRFFTKLNQDNLFVYAPDGVLYHYTDPRLSNYDGQYGYIQVEYNGNTRSRWNSFEGWDLNTATDALDSAEVARAAIYAIPDDSFEKTGSTISPVSLTDTIRHGTMLGYNNAPFALGFFGEQAAWIEGDVKIQGDLDAGFVSSTGEFLFPGGSGSIGSQFVGSGSIYLDYPSAGQLYVRQSGLPAFIHISSGRQVGIGWNITPYYQLDVDGDVRIRSTSKLTFGGTGSGDADANLYRLSASHLITDDTLTITGDLNVTGNTKFAGNGTPGSGKIPKGTDNLGNWTWEPDTVGSGGVGGSGDTTFTWKVGSSGTAKNDSIIFDTTATIGPISEDLSNHIALHADSTSWLATDYDVSLKLSTSLTQNNFFMGNGSNIATVTTPADARTALSVPVFDLTDPGATNIFPKWDDTGNEVDWESAATFKTSLSLQNVTNESKATMFTSPEFTGSPVLTLGADAAGDMWYRNAGVITRLPIGTNGWRLGVSAGIPTWAASDTVGQAAINASKAATATTITAGDGLQGGGDLSTNRTITASPKATGGLVNTSDSLAVDSTKFPATDYDVSLKLAITSSTVTEADSPQVLIQRRVSGSGGATQDTVAGIGLVDSANALNGTTRILNTTGTGTTGQQPTKQSDGTVTWAAAGGNAPTMTINLACPVLAALTWTNMPSALSFFLSTATVGKSITKADLSNFDSVRIHVNKQGTAGAASSKVIFRYLTTFTQTASSWLDIGTSEVSVATNNTNTFTTTSWIPLAAGAKADVFITLMGSGGDGTLDPAFGMILAEFK